jgi:hypothetical protein
LTVGTITIGISITIGKLTVILLITMFPLLSNNNPHWNAGSLPPRNQEVRERTDLFTSLHCLTIKNQLHYLTTVNYVPWFPLSHHPPWLMWLNNGDTLLYKYEFSCHKIMVQLPLLRNFILHVPPLTCEICIHVRSLNVHHFRMVGTTERKLMASRSSSMTSLCRIV